MLIAGRARAFVFAVLATLVAGCPNGAGITCPNGQTFCNGRCTFVANDPQNCGACGNVCPGLLVCIAGTCGCPPNQANCGNTCVDQNVDANNCGMCGHACAAGEVCAAAACATTCGPNLMQCGSSCIDVQNDPKNCGQCGNACAATDICCGGSCVTSGTDAHCMGCVACPMGMTCVNFFGGDMGNVCGQPG